MLLKTVYKKGENAGILTSIISFAHNAFFFQGQVLSFKSKLTCLQKLQNWTCQRFCCFTLNKELLKGFPPPPILDMGDGGGGGRKRGVRRSDFDGKQKVMNNPFPINHYYLFSFFYIRIARFFHTEIAHFFLH